MRSEHPKTITKIIIIMPLNYLFKSIKNIINVCLKVMRLHRKIVLAKGSRDYGKNQGTKTKGGAFPGLSRDCPLISRDSLGQTPFRPLIPFFLVLPLGLDGALSLTLSGGGCICTCCFGYPQIALSYLAHIFWKQSLHKLRMGFARHLPCLKPKPRSYPAGQK